MKTMGRVLLVTAMLTSVTAFMGSATVGAASDTVVYPSMKCSLSLFGGAPFPPDMIPETVNLQIGLTAPDSVAPGSGAEYTVTVGGDPGLMNAEFSAFNNGRAEAVLLVNGTEVTTPVVTIPDTPTSTALDIPDLGGTIPDVTAATTVEVARLRYYTLNDTGAVVADSTCAFPEGNRALVTVGVAAESTTAPSTTAPSPTAPPPDEVGDTVLAESVACAGQLTLVPGLPPTPIAVPPAEGVLVTLTAPGAVPTGSTIDFTVEIAGDPGFVNGPVAFTAGTARLFVAVNGDRDNLIATPPLPVPDVAPNQPIEIPLVEGTVGPVDGQTTIEVVRANYSNAQASVTCTLAEADRPVVTVAIDDSQPPTTAPPITAPPTTAPPTTAPPTTAPPTTAPPTTAPPSGPGQAKLVSKTVNLPYSCDVAYGSGFNLPGQANPIDVTVWAPDRATVGTTYKVFMDFGQGINNGPFEVPAGAVNGFTSELLIGTQRTPSTFDHGTNAAPIPANGALPVTRHISTVTASGSAGDTIPVAPGTVEFATDGFTANGTSISPGTVVCTVDAPAVLSTELTDEVLEQPDDDPAPATTSSAQSSTNGTGNSGNSGNTGNTGNTAAPVDASSGSAAVQAQVIEESAQVTYECEIYSGSSLITTQQDVQTVTIKTVDKVAPGATLSFQMTLDPGPTTGPVPLPTGVENVTVGATAGGGASPTAITMNVGDLTAPVETNSHVKVPTVSGSTQATGSAGDSITLTASDMRFETSAPPSRTECTAQNPPVITTTQIVEGVESSAASEELAFTGSSRGWLVPLAMVQVAVGLGLVLMQRRRRLA